MPSEEEVYRQHAAEYEAVIAAEDFEGNILRVLDEIAPPDGRDVLDLGAGTGRLATLLARRAKSIRAFDLSAHMLTVTREKLLSLAPGRGLVAAADHRFLPLPPACADLVVSGWSVSYVAVWNPARWREELDAWMDEMRRVLRPGGMVLLFESLGTGNNSPRRLPHLENFYSWLDKTGFENTWIRTDYHFSSVSEAAHLAGFFFGEVMGRRIENESITVLPECTGVWWKTIP